jgi:hypothetical protein
MWILNFIPDFVIHLTALVGLVALILISFFDHVIPLVYRMPVKLASIAVLVLSLFLEGANYNNTAWQERVAEMEAKVAQSEVKSVAANTEIKIVYRDRIKVVQDTQIVVQEKIREVEKIVDAKCEVAPEAIDILNQAAKGGRP